MMASLECARCLQTIPERQHLTCVVCKENYDIQCANVSFTRYYNTMDRSNWECQQCINKRLEQHNLDTPKPPIYSRPQRQIVPSRKAAEAASMSLKETQNFTMASRKPRRPQKPPVHRQDTSSDDDINILGDTPLMRNINSLLQEHTPEKPSHQSMITIDQIEELLDRKLETIKISILNEVKSTIISATSNQIKKLREEVTDKTNFLTVEQSKLKKTLADTNKAVIELQKENLKLQKEIQAIQKSCLTQPEIHQQKDIAETETSKKIVLYGLEENERDEHELYERIVYIFQDILNINLAGYVEDMKRLGKWGKRRPLVIELLSKSMTRHILQNRRYFRNTGLSISDYLGPEAQQERKKLIEKLVEARRNGQRANIINNKLIIDGREFTEANETQINTPTNNYHKTDETKPSHGNRQQTTSSNRSHNKQTKITPSQSSDMFFRK